jgi:hypothetical protein
MGGIPRIFKPETSLVSRIVEFKWIKVFSSHLRLVMGHFSNP